MALACAFAAVPGMALAATGPDFAAALNAARLRGCGGLAGVDAPLQADERLNRVALQHAALGGDVRKVFLDAGYAVTRWAMLRFRGSGEPASIAGAAARDFCKHLIDPAFSQVGVYRDGREVTVVMAAPPVLPREQGAALYAARVLELVNEARSRPQLCGKKPMPSAHPLRANALLDRVALVHAADMASHNYFAHEGRDGSLVGDRVTRGGYRWRSVGENIAAGQPTPELAMKSWMDSPGHCETLMGAQYTELGIAYAVDLKSKSLVYWVQVFASTR